MHHKGAVHITFKYFILCMRLLAKFSVCQELHDASERAPFNIQPYALLPQAGCRHCCLPLFVSFAK